MQNKDLAPIALFVYNRPKHTEQTLEALSKNVLADESELFIFADGPKPNATTEDLKSIEEVKNVLFKKKWCKEVIVYQNESNQGLAQNVINGVSSVVNKHGKIIVLEDDLITSPKFLEYCNNHLELYKDEKNVYSINGFQFPLDIKENKTFLCPLATSSWGWATWADRWKHFDMSIANKNIIQNRRLIKQRFNIADYDYATMLNNKNSWAIKWYYSVFIRNGLGLFPTKSLVYNIGFDGSGTHDSAIISQNIYSGNFPLIKEETINLEYYGRILDYFQNTPSGINKISFLINSLINRCSKLLKK